MRGWIPEAEEYQEREPRPQAGKGVLKTRTKTYRCGDQLEAEIFPVLEWQREQRAEKKKRTPEQMKRVNQRNAEKKLARLMNLNFGPGDLMLNALTCAAPCSFGEFCRRVRNFMDKVRREMKKRGLELKYIYHLEQTGKGDQVRYHLHGIINRGIDRDTIESWWPWGTGNVDRVKKTEGGLTGYARYMLQKKDGQESAGHRRTRCSRNLKKPDRRPYLTVSDSKFSRAQAGRLALACEQDARELFEKKYPGYRFLDCAVRYSDYLPGVYVYARMERIPHS